ncbi:MAG: ISKra4 family transposase, partial [Desulfobacterales bacterium]|nr:ISKra4 family transposase [Desulfobacterales bacterium]
MDAKIIKRSEKSFIIEVEIPYGKSMIESEELIQQQINKAGSLATGEALLRFDTDGSPIIIEGRKMTSKGKINKTYQTPYGDISIERHFYQSSSGGRGFCPLEKNARIITTATPKFAKIVSSKYADMGGIRVQNDLEDNHGRKISKSHIQKICDVVGSIASEKEEFWNYKIPSLEKEVKTVTIGLDGTCMLTVEDGYRQAMVGTIGLYDDEGTRLHTIYTAARPEYGKQIFLNKMENEISRIKQLYPDSKYVGLADGAKDNWPFLEKHTSAQIIDFYHASEYIVKAGNAAITNKNERKA